MLSSKARRRQGRLFSSSHQCSVDEAGNVCQVGEWSNFRSVTVDIEIESSKTENTIYIVDLKIEEIFQPGSGAKYWKQKVSVVFSKDFLTR